MLWVMGRERWSQNKTHQTFTSGESPDLMFCMSGELLMNWVFAQHSAVSQADGWMSRLSGMKCFLFHQVQLWLVASRSCSCFSDSHLESHLVLGQFRQHMDAMHVLRLVGPFPPSSTCMASFCGLVLRYCFILEDQHNENQNEKHHEGITKG